MRVRAGAVCWRASVHTHGLLCTCRAASTPGWVYDTLGELGTTPRAGPWAELTLPLPPATVVVQVDSLSVTFDYTRKMLRTTSRGSNSRGVTKKMELIIWMQWKSSRNKISLGTHKQQAYAGRFLRVSSVSYNTHRPQIPQLKLSEESNDFKSCVPRITSCMASRGGASCTPPRPRRAVAEEFPSPSRSWSPRHHAAQRQSA